MKKSLYLVNSVYHLLSAVNLKRKAGRFQPGDLILTDLTPGLFDLAPRLRETGLFSRVILAQAKELPSQYPMNREESVARCFEEREAVLQWALGEELEEVYDQVFYPNFDWLARLLACKYSCAPCQFFWVEDGFSSYVIDFVRPDRAAVNRHPLGGKLGEKTEAALLYEPRLAMRGDSLPNRSLPKLSKEDEGLIQTLNYIFEYRPPENLPPFLFLEQSFRAEGIQGNDLELIERCRKAVGSQALGVKSHPRNQEDLPFQLGLARRVRLEVPWELFLLNQRENLPTVVTVCSNGALSGRLCLGLDLNTVMLYKLYTGRVLWKEDQRLSQYLEAFRRQFAGKHYYVPKTLYEMESVLKYLGGQYGDESVPHHPCV